MPKSCRYVPTCSEYSMIAYKKYGVVKGTVLTVWRLCRCNPLGKMMFHRRLKFLSSLWIFTGAILSFEWDTISFVDKSWSNILVCRSCIFKHDRRIWLRSPEMVWRGKSTAGMTLGIKYMYRYMDFGNANSWYWKTKLLFMVFSNAGHGSILL